MPLEKNIESEVVDPAEEENEVWEDDWGEENKEGRHFSRMGFLEHLGELRNRIYKIIIILLLGIVVCWNFVGPIWKVLQRPALTMLENAQEKSLSVTKQAKGIEIRLPDLPELPESFSENEEAKQFKDYLGAWLEDANKEISGQIQELLVAKDSKLMQTAITEAFFLKVKVAALAGLALTYPFLMYQIWAFIVPGLYRRERRIAFPFIFFSTLFFVAGLMFGYFVAVPFAGKFLMAFGTEFVQLITIQKYMSFMMTMLIGLGLVFEIPMVIFLLAKLGIATPRWLIRNFRYAVLLIVSIAAIITPTGDPINLAIFSVPMIGLYWLGVLVAAIWGKKRDKVEEED
jgi:sec-independent protein translocase protein TatC